MTSAFVSVSAAALTAMRPHARRAIVAVSAALLSAATLSACGDGGAGTAPASSQVTPPAAPPAQSFGYVSGATRQGSVQFPTGVTETLDSLTAVNGFGTAPVSASGTFTLSTLSSTAQYAAINTPAGVPLLCGWLGEAEPVINVHTTAEVYVYFAAYIYTVPDAASRTAIVTSISQLPGLSAVEQAISNALVANPNASPSSDQGVASAISTLLASLQASNAPAAAGLKAMSDIVAGARPVTHSLLFNPGTSASGITILDNGQNSIQFQNTLRRGAVAYVDEVSHVDASGASVQDQKPDTNPPVTIPAVNAIGTFGGAIANYVNGNYALVPILTDLQEVPNLPGAKSTTYRIAIVGPGDHLGDYNSLTPLEQGMETELFVKQMICEVTLPLIASTLVPVGEWGEEIFESPAVQTLLQDTIATLAATNAVAEAAESGDPKGVYDAIVATLAGNVTLTEPLLKAAIAAVNLVAEKTGAAALSVEAEALVIPLKLADGIIAVADYLFIVKDDGNADKGDLFTVVATDPTITLTPASSSIAVNATVTLTAALHPPQNTEVVYQYTNTALFGHLTPTTGGAGTDNFTTTNPNVTYTANGTGGGTDTITVTPQYLVTGLPNESIGTVSATVTVAGSVVASTIPLQQVILTFPDAVALFAAFTPNASNATNYSIAYAVSLYWHSPPEPGQFEQAGAVVYQSQLGANMPPALDTSQLWTGGGGQYGDSFQAPTYSSVPTLVPAYNLGGGQVGFLIASPAYGSINQPTLAQALALLNADWQAVSAASPGIVINSPAWPITFNGSTYPPPSN